MHASTAPAGPGMNIKPFLKLMVQRQASDLFFSPMATIKVKIEGTIISVGKDKLTAEQVKEAAYSIMNPGQIRFLEEELEVDFAISEPGLGRFRANVFHQRGQIAMVLRFITLEMPSLDKLGVPKVLTPLSEEKRGLVLMVGATGSGKSTTLAAMINHRNETTASHILTIEDPIEFLHNNKKSIVNQRELGLDTKSYTRALRSAVREAPDVILVGEIRDAETMWAALTLAGTGHLCISTLHANNSSEALDRIINMFPQSQHRQVLMDLSHYLKAILAQRLVMGRNNRRHAAVEVMLNTPHVRDLIMKGDVSGIKDSLKESSEGGMQSFDEALYRLYRDGRIDLSEALGHADSSTDLEARINFGS